MHRPEVREVRPVRRVRQVGGGLDAEHRLRRRGIDLQVGGERAGRGDGQVQARPGDSRRAVPAGEMGVAAKEGLLPAIEAGGRRQMATGDYEAWTPDA